MWVYKVKLNPRGEVTRHKARLMAKGFLQKEGTDFDEVFAPVVRIETIRLVVGLANMNNWQMCQMDVKCAFLKWPFRRRSLCCPTSWFCEKWRRKKGVQAT